ncbi:MAG: molecular chaperone HtpG, partial [Lachnospiraceae bacterium]|nr:molecular chaperone HtpG [Lachnospiraceae bacterium]
KEGHGTVITLHLNDDSTEFSNEFRAREVLQKYCAFMPVEIYINDETREPMLETIDKEELLETDVIIETILEPAETEEKENEDGTKEIVEIAPAKEKYKIEQRPVPVNDTKPLWNKHPNECTEEEYKDFYRKVFQDYKEPLFWIHLNMDYPFNLKGILYFPKINMEYESIEGKIKLFNNQVFIADNIKEVIPEFLMLLKGTIDCPDLPLNVSRSALQNDGFVKKISDYITKKVADKLSGMCKTDRENYEKYWDDINPFIKFGCLKDEKFAEKMNDYIIFKNLEDKYLTLKDYLEAAKEKNHENQVFYVTDATEQSQYINMFKEAELDAVYLTQAIDNPFMTQLEYKNEGVKFQRIDADVNDIFKETDAATDESAKETLTETFKAALRMDQLEVKVEKLKNAGLASMITVSEESRRIQEMMKMYSAQGMGMGMFPVSETLVLNANNSLVKYVLNHKDDANTAKICEQLYDLAKLAHGSLSPERMTKFIARSSEIMMIMTGEE